MTRSTATYRAGSRRSGRHVGCRGRVALELAATRQPPLGQAVHLLAVLAGFFAVDQLGELLELPRAVTGLSPYTHPPAMPVEHFAASPALLLSALAAALTAAAWWRLRERDIR